MTRVERIRDAIAITDVLAELGYHVQPGDREQQFGCDLHGTRDTKPSARVYPDSNSWYCFACSRTRDAISTVMDKLDLDFKSAMAWLEKTYNLPTYTPQVLGETQTLEDSLAVTLAPVASGTPEQICRGIRALLDSQRYDKALSCAQTMTLWAEYDTVIVQSETDPTGALTALLTLRDKVTAQVRHAARTS